jgi:Beta-propeller repeat
VAIITGYTQSANFPTANAAQAVYRDNGDAFVAKLSATGSALVYSTYLGGNDSENNGSATLLGISSYVLASFGGALAVDFDGSAYVTGWTYSTNFPVLNAFQPTNAAFSPGLNNAAFITKFDAAGNLVYSTYFGGEFGDFSRAIGFDFAGNVYVAGSSHGGLPTTLAFQPTFGGDGSDFIGDGFIAAFDSTGTNLIYCTYLGGSGDDQINGIAVRPEDGAVAVTGFTDSPNFPLLNAVQPTGYQGFFKSANGANAWNLSNSGLTIGIIDAILVDPSNPSVIVYGLVSVSDRGRNGLFY